MSERGRERKYVSQLTITFQIILISGVVHNKVALDGPTENPDLISHFTAVRKLGDNPLPPDFKSRLMQNKVRTPLPLSSVLRKEN